MFHANEGLKSCGNLAQFISHLFISHLFLYGHFLVSCRFLKLLVSMTLKIHACRASLAEDRAEGGPEEGKFHLLHSAPNDQQFSPMADVRVPSKG